ncbi:rhomboid family intramembrane serine protease [Salipaludibacillus neizhouensis]|uniref:Rhomboid family intramembrane serine protease n=1 Tax=Salipaludibacillus neizhouensis TaxID=885475 RepID=A0A3A9KJN8_9BACI|nr:rhomboid family intramembrane serine protease [Salipaludibacillus neizhouensis]RKL65106.1 rhomboid family intramembrane serine protease [Salipaludibacillus neizhouensis]
MFIRNETFGGFIRSYKVITVLVAINIFFYIWTDLFPFLGGEEIRMLGVGQNIAIAMGEYWRLITPIFLHGGLMHMAFNSFALILFGPALEIMFGRSRFLTFYLATGILANIAYLYLGNPYGVHLGASGAIYGLFGVYLYMVFYRKDLIDKANSQLILTVLVIGVVMTFINPGINILAHIFGLISGAALGPIFLMNLPSRNRSFQNVHDNSNVGFDPNRWANRENRKKKIIIMAVLGIAGMILFFYLVSTFLL